MRMINPVYPVHDFAFVQAAAESLGRRVAAELSEPKAISLGVAPGEARPLVRKRRAPAAVDVHDDIGTFAVCPFSLSALGLATSFDAGVLAAAALAVVALATHATDVDNEIDGASSRASELAGPVILPAASAFTTYNNVNDHWSPRHRINNVHAD